MKKGNIAVCPVPVIVRLFDCIPDIHKMLLQSKFNKINANQVLQYNHVCGVTVS